MKVGVLRGRLLPPLHIDVRTVHVSAPAAVVYDEFTRIGGPNGWYAYDWAWRLRGWLDRRLGGPGLDRTTPYPPAPRPGDRRDLWCVLDVEPGRRLRLHALMRVPGRAELDWSVVSCGPMRCILSQTARFRPSGLSGRLYWCALLPIHRRIFQQMAHAIARRATERPSALPVTR